MKRRNLIKGLGALSAAAIIPAGNALAGTLQPKVKMAKPTHFKGSSVCWLTPAKTEGPYYFNANLNRADIRYDTLHGNQFFDGVRLNMNITVIDFNCNPIPGVIVDVWHCDKDGAYSGYNGQPGGNWAGWNFMRGFQTTDSNGVASFITSYPGWYVGRATHIHFKVRLNTTTYVTSQYCFPDATNTTIYAIMYPTANGDGTYTGNYTIGINSPVGINDPGMPVEGFELKQNYPNPFNPTTRIGYSLGKSEFVKLTVFDVMGKEVKRFVNSQQAAGSHEIVFEAGELASGYYIYTIEAGDFNQSEDMLLIK